MAGPSTIGEGTGSVLSLTARNAQGTVAIDYQGEKLLTFSGASLAPDGTRPTVVDQAGSSIAFGSPATVKFTPRRWSAHLRTAPARYSARIASVGSMPPTRLAGR
jgi:hypothetical protein